MAINRSFNKGTSSKVRIIQWPFYAWFKKHRCFKCKGKLKFDWISQEIYEGSFDATGKNLTWIGLKKGMPIKYTFAIFKCKDCGHQISIPQQRKLEKPNKTYYLGLDAYGRLMQDDYEVYLVGLEKAKQALEKAKKEQNK